MDGIINENKLFVVKEYEFDKKDIHEIDYLLDDVMMLLKIVEETTFIHLNIKLFMILTLQIFLITKKSIS